MSVALFIQQVTRLRHIFVCGLPRSTVFFHVISNGTIFRKQDFEHTRCVLILYTTLFFLTGAQDSHLQTVTIPEAAYIQLRRRPPEDEQG